MIDVTCAVIRNDDDEVLVVQRGEASDHPFKWEFPGGKLADGETEEDCIIREITEELSMDIVICGRLPDVEHDYGHKKIRLIPFICYTLNDLPVLTEHLAYRWLSADELLMVDYSEADIKVSENYLKSINFERKEEKTAAHSDTVVTPDDVSGLQDMVIRVRSTREAEWIATSAIENPAIFNKLLEFSFSKDIKLSFHASWALSKACDISPKVAYPIIPGIIEALDKVVGDSALRSFLRIISLSDISQISSRHQGIIAGYCFEALKSAFTTIAVKAYSMEILYKLALIYPELTNELSATISMLQGEGSAGVLARGHSILKKLAFK
jgi:8-oxo-dGTP diphosphatase